MSSGSILLIFFLLANFKVAYPSIVLEVDNLKGNDKYCGGQEVRNKTSCRTLEKVGKLIQVYKKDVNVVIATNATLYTIFKVVNASNIQITGPFFGKNRAYINCKNQNSAFLINNVTNFSFSNLAIVNCSGKFSKIYAYRFGFLIQASSGITIFNAHFINCTNTALIFSNNKGEIALNSTSFIYNQKHRSRDSYEYFKASYPSALSIEQNVLDDTSAAHYLILRSLFDNNISPRTKRVSDYDTVDELYSFRKSGYGGALFIEFGGNTNGSCVIIKKTNFRYNTGERGGAVYAYFRQNASHNSIQIVKSRFYRNNAHTCGAGISTGFFNSPSLLNDVLVSKCLFIENTALIAAGMRIYTVYSKQNVSKPRSVFVTNSVWTKNRAILSSAVDIIPVNRGFKNEGYLPVLEFINCTFTNNTNNNKPKRHNKKSYFTDSGVFSVTNTRVTFGGKTRFLHNRFTALLLLSGMAEFLEGSDVLFMNNSGYYGGAIAMYSFSMIVMNPFSFFNITKNHAILNGGGIFYQPTDRHVFLRGDVQCFLRSRVNKNLSLIDTIRVVFENNTAEVGGASIYAESVYSCYFRCYSIIKHSHIKYLNRTGDGFVQCVGDFTFDQGSKHHPSITTSAGRFVFYKNNTSWNVVPGDKLELSFNVTDSFNRTMQPLMNIRKIDERARIWVNNPYSLTSTIYPFGKANATSTFTLAVLSLNQLAFDFNMTLLPCPPGFHNKKGKCICAAGKMGYTSIVKCDEDAFSAVYATDSWVGYIPENSSHHTLLYFSPCFGPICNNTNRHLPKYRQYLTVMVCGLHREGIMCGKCVKNYSTFYHSQDFTCGPNHRCHLGPLFYFLSEIVPVITFFVVVITFDVSFTTGWLVGFVFFTQYVNELDIQSYNKLFSYLHTPFQVFYGLFNFEFFNIEKLSYCLWKGAQIQDVLAVRYVTTVVAFFLVLIFIAVMQNNLCGRLCKLRRHVSAKSSVVHGLSSFLVICYAECTKTSFYILKYTQPVGYKGAYENYYSYYGGLPYFHRQHLIYAVPALISLVFVTVLPPVVLLLYPLSLQLLSFCSLSEHCLVNRALTLSGISKIMPFIDCFQSCFKDKLRFFAGLYFVYRVAVLLAFSFNSTSFGFSLSSGLLLTVILGVHSTLQPYRRTHHNKVDSLLFLNLALINTCVVLIKNAVSQEVNTSFILVISVIQLVLLYLPMFAIMLVLCKISLTFMRSHRNEAGLIPVDDMVYHREDSSQDANPDPINSRRSYGSLRDAHEWTNDTY